MPARNIVIGQNVTSAKVQRAKELRQDMTEAEKVLWQAVRANRLNGWHFRRQQVIGGFIADFYCHAAALVVELDGSIHKNQQEYDRERTELIRDFGIEVIRFRNVEIENQLPQVLQKIDSLCRERAKKKPGI
jgi:very-short-patch-repair endonuclease